MAVMHLSVMEVLAFHMERYEKRTQRHDGFDIIRDTLARYGVHRFNALADDNERLLVTQEIIDIFERAS